MTGMLKILLCSIVLVGAASSLSMAQEAAATATLKFKAPSGWVEEKASSAMRVAQYKLPKAADDTEDGSLVVYFFGQGQGGGTTANIERWVNQMKQPDGSASNDKAKEETG